MKSREEILPISSIVVDEELYPRNAWNWQTSYDYAMSIQAGAKFPPVTVALFEGKYLLIDGRHRIEAFKQIKDKHVSAVILEGLGHKEIYLEAVKANIGHGRAFSPHEKRQIIVRLEELEYDLGEISSVIQIPTDKIKTFVGKTLTNSITGEKIVLKAPLANLVGTEVPEGTEEEQRVFNARNQSILLEEFIRLLRNNWLDLENKIVRAKLKEIKKLLKEVK